MNDQALLPRCIKSIESHAPAEGSGAVTALRRWSLAIVIVILNGAVSPITTSGQELLDGTSIRVRTSQSTEPGSQWIEGTVVRLTPDNVWYESNDVVSTISIDNAEIQRATDRNHQWRGLAIGAIAGAAVGGVVAYARYEPRFCTSSWPVFGSCSGQTNSLAGDTALGAVLGGRYGAGLGFLVGTLFGRWETVELDQLIVGDGNLAVSVRIRR